MKHVMSGDLVYHHALTEIPLCKQTSLDAELICHITFMGRLWVWGKGDVVELAKAKPLAIDRHAKVAEIDGLPGGLGDLVGGGSRGFALRRQIRHDDSADARQSQHHRGEKRRSSFCSRDRWKAPPRKITESMRRGNQRGWKEHQNKEDKRPTRGRPSAGVRKGAAFPPLYACILLSSLLQLSELRCCLEETALASPPPPPSPLLQPLVIPFVQTGDLKCKTAPCWKSQPSSGQLSTGSLWLDCLCTAVNALGGCWPRWLTVVLGTATHCHVSRWCMRKKKKKGGGGRRGSPEYPTNANDAAEDSSVSQASTASPDLKQRPSISAVQLLRWLQRDISEHKGNKAKDPGYKWISCGFNSPSFFSINRQQLASHCTSLCCKMTITLTFWTFTSYKYQKLKTNTHTLIQFLQLCNMSTNLKKKKTLDIDEKTKFRTINTWKQHAQNCNSCC